MELQKALARRYSVRSYNSRPVSDEDLEIILKAGCAAPVGLRAFGSMHLTVVQQEKALNDIRRLAEAYDTRPITRGMAQKR